jgi:hypothetical protein
VRRIGRTYEVRGILEKITTYDEIGKLGSYLWLLDLVLCRFYTFHQLTLPGQSLGKTAHGPTRSSVIQSASSFSELGQLLIAARGDVIPSARPSMRSERAIT